MGVPVELGAPGVYQLPPTPIRALTGVRMDVCAFVGVSPRGPSREPVFDPVHDAEHEAFDPERPRRRSVPVAVEGFDEYRRLFGAFDGPGLLPYAVASFFEQGGRRAYVVRIVHEYEEERLNFTGVARARLEPLRTQDGTPVKLRARNEGAWGNGLRARLSYGTKPVDVRATGATELAVEPGLAAPAGTLLRLALDDGTRVLRFVTSARAEGREGAAGWVHYGILDAGLPGPIERAEIVQGVLEVLDGAGRTERLEALGFSPLHPRYLASVLLRESELLAPDPKWIRSWLVPGGAELPEAATRRFRGGRDRYGDIVHDDFFEADWFPGEERVLNGVHALAEIEEVSLLVVPDLYAPRELAELEDVRDPVTFAGPEFERCVEPGEPTAQATTPDPLERLTLDPRTGPDLKRIVELQRRLETLAEQLGTPVVLLDVPPGLDQRQILRWRSSFSSSYVAAYHPWLRASRPDDRRDTAVRVNPSAVAAGIVARRELELGVPHGPANELARGIIDLGDAVSDEAHDVLHPASVNVFRRERDGIRLTAARTLSLDASYRQLSVRRLMTLLRRTLEEEMQWTVFEPNNASLRSQVRDLLETFLGELYLANAFAGASEGEAFFVRCDAQLNPPQVVDAGQLVAEIGVAPAEPLEFLVLRIERDGDGTLRVRGDGA